jgi:hypothetical protein
LAVEAFISRHVSPPPNAAARAHVGPEPPSISSRSTAVGKSVRCGQPAPPGSVAAAVRDADAVVPGRRTATARRRASRQCSGTGRSRRGARHSRASSRVGVGPRAQLGELWPLEAAGEKAVLAAVRRHPLSAVAVFGPEDDFS